MSLPAPKPGLVIRYSFLWSGEHAEGAEEGARDRPCAIVVAVRRDPNGDIQTIVAPITHRPPRDPAARSRSLPRPEGAWASMAVGTGRVSTS
ncbi:MAG: hypothetical protein AB7O88_26040 [Reyranellaceae bacterium]